MLNACTSIYLARKGNIEKFKQYLIPIQVVTEKANKFKYDLITSFEKISGVPVIINTSLNFKGQPIVENPLDAISSFYTSQLEFLMLENFLLKK
ncbi:MAG: hypothetical protein LBI80_03470 [Endomicrobium sp.]|nr:hypothetical protein [Endomicrobium sp.]